MQKDIENLHKKYAPNELVYDLVYGHCQIVAEFAVWCAKNVTDNKVDLELLNSAALLHDIGTYVYFDENGQVKNEKLYPLHAIYGAKILLDEGFDPKISQIVETHVLLGLSKQEIIDRPWPLPAKNYLPKTIEAELLCYADRFHSKHPQFNSYEGFLGRLKESLPLQAARFEAMSKRFGIPDVSAMSKKYNQPLAQ